MKVGQLMRSVAPVNSLGPGSRGPVRKWATALKTGRRAGASTRLPPPLKEPNGGATLPLDQQIHFPLAWWP